MDAFDGAADYKLEIATDQQFSVVYSAETVKPHHAVRTRFAWLYCWRVTLRTCSPARPIASAGQPVDCHLQFACGTPQVDRAAESAGWWFVAKLRFVPFFLDSRGGARTIGSTSAPIRALALR